jgi:hypothetical protein
MVWSPAPDKPRPILSALAVSVADTGAAAGKCFLDMLRGYTEFEINLRCERRLGSRRLAVLAPAGCYATEFLLLQYIWKPKKFLYSSNSASIQLPFSFGTAYIQVSAQPP